MLKTLISALYSHLPLVALLTLTFYYCLKYIRTFVEWRLKMRRIEKGLQGFPGPPKHWLFGNLKQLPGPNEKGLMWFLKWQKSFPKAMTVWFGPMNPFLQIYHPDTIKAVLKSTLPKQVSGVLGYTTVLPWLGEGLLLSSGPKWFRNRRLLTPGFHFDVLKPYMKIYNTACDTLLGKFNKISNEEASVDVFKPVSLCTLEIILKCAFSSDMDVQKQGDSHPYVNAVTRIAQLVIKRLFTPLLHPKIFFYISSPGREFRRLVKYTHDVSLEVIRKRKEILENNPDDIKKRYPDFLDILLLARDENDKGLTDTEIRDEVDTFLFEGHDTTASAISWALHTLAKHPEHQQKCYDEISKVLSGRDTDEIFWDDLNHFPYLTLCIKESMRLHSPVPNILREVDNEFVLEGVRLASGTNITIAINLLHHNEEIWGDDVHEYRPERFDKDLPADMDSFAFIPFSAGPRNCIGQSFAMHEIKVVLAKTIYRYVMTTDPAYPALLLAQMVMRAENGLHVFLKERSQIIP